jgi:hypothetical protein
MTRKNVIRIVFQNSDRKSVPVQKTKNADAPGASPRHYGAPVAMALYNQGSGIPILQMNRICPRHQRGQGWRKGGGGRSIQQEIRR